MSRSRSRSRSRSYSPSRPQSKENGDAKTEHKEVKCTNGPYDKVHNSWYQMDQMILFSELSIFQFTTPNLVGTVACPVNHANFW